MIKFLLGFSAGFISAGLIGLVIVELSSVNQTAIKPSTPKTAPTVAISSGFAPREIYQFKALEITVVKTEITSEGIGVQVEIKNVSPNEVSFFPTFGSAAIGDRQFNFSSLKTVGDDFGNIQPNVVKKSTLYFAAEGQPIENISEIQSINLSLGDEIDSSGATKIKIQLKRSN